MLNINNTKTCPKCGIEKTLGQYYKRKESPDGRRSTCIVCENKQSREAYMSGASKEHNRTKTCTKCETEKTMGQFYKRKESSDGRYSACIVCTNLKIREAYESGTPEEKAARTKARIEANKRYLAKNPSKKEQYKRARKIRSATIETKLLELERRIEILEILSK